jgi:hypothetical protein
MPETYFRPKATSEQLQCSIDKLAINRMKGIGIPYVVFGGSILYKLSDIEQYITANTITPGTPTPPGIKRRKGGPGRPRKAKPSPRRTKLARRAA